MEKGTEPRGGVFEGPVKAKELLTTTTKPTIDTKTRIVILRVTDLE
jgi:hypothetical protein